MSQKANPKRTSENEVVASARMIRTSPSKLNLVAGLIRGKSVADAMNHLLFSRKRISTTVVAVLKSAIANAENNHNLDIDTLRVSQVMVGKAMVMKRFRARARGRGARILKPFSNLTIKLAQVTADNSVQNTNKRKAS